jgi:hypothetical protein
MVPPAWNVFRLGNGLRPKFTGGDVEQSAASARTVTSTCQVPMIDGYAGGHPSGRPGFATARPLNNIALTAKPQISNVILFIIGSLIMTGDDFR